VGFHWLKFTITSFYMDVLRLHPSKKPQRSGRYASFFEVNMPEGPEIRREALRLHQALAGEPLSEVFFKFDHLKPYESIFAGMAPLAVTSKGKAMLIHMPCDLSIYSHNQLYGKWYVRNAGKNVESNRDLRLKLGNSRKTAFLFSASDIEVLDPDELKQHRFLKKLGPDVLDATCTEKIVEERLQDKRFRNKMLHSLLLDQHFLSGPGNYLRSETLFHAGILGQRRPKDLSEAEVARLARSILLICRRSLATGGITNDPDLAEALRKAGWSYEARRFYVFDRKDRVCHQCGEYIVREEAGNRRIFHCPGCQV
jgi:endonuclease-8